MYKILFTSLIGVAIFAAGCTDAAAPRVVVNNTATPAMPAATKTVDEHGHEDDAPRIVLAEAKKEFDTGNAVFIDTRSSDTFKHEHVKGAINITNTDVASKADTIPKGKKIIAYCS